MSDRTDLPKIKLDQPPTIFNAEAGNFGLATSATAALIGAIKVDPRSLKKAIDQGKSTTQLEALTIKKIGELKSLAWYVLAAGAVGALVGGLIGKSQQEKEQTQGRTVKTPGYLNLGILGGWFAADMLKWGYKAGTLSTIKDDKLVAKEAVKLLKSNKNPGAPKVLTILSFATPAFMAIGSIMRKESLQRDFDKAVAVRDANHAKTQQLLEAAIANQNNPPLRDEAPTSYKDSVTPKESAALFEKQAQGATAHADKHESAQSHADHAEKTEANASMAVGA